MTTTLSPPSKRALIHAADGEVVLWCPACKKQIVRLRGQISIGRLALAEMQHQIKSCPKTQEK